jgi:hypothetical protein
VYLFVYEPIVVIGGVNAFAVLLDTDYYSIDY